MTIFTVEKSLNGLYSALFFAFERKILPDYISERETRCKNFTDTFIDIKTDERKAQRVEQAIIRYSGEKTVAFLQVCLLSGEDRAIKVAFDLAYLSISQKIYALNLLSDKVVSTFLYTIKKVLNEKHRFKGFIRFKETASGILYAEYAPDNDITDLLCPHFVQRLSAVPFVIHDVKRNKAGVSNGKEYKIMAVDKTATLNLSEDEKAWEDLWKNYYKAVNIKERKNKKQQDNLMPLRYRRFLSETYE